MIIDFYLSCIYTYGIWAVCEVLEENIHKDTKIGYAEAHYIKTAINKYTEETGYSLPYLKQRTTGRPHTILKYENRMIYADKIKKERLNIKSTEIKPATFPEFGIHQFVRSFGQRANIYSEQGSVSDFFNEWLNNGFELFRKHFPDSDLTQMHQNQHTTL